MDNPMLCNGRDKRGPPTEKSEGHARHARGIGVDYPTRCNGPDKRVPPTEKSEGHARHARRSGMDCQTLRGGREKQVPPRSGPDTQVPPKLYSGNSISAGSENNLFHSYQKISSFDLPMYRGPAPPLGRR